MIDRHRRSKDHSRNSRGRSSDNTLAVQQCEQKERLAALGDDCEAVNDFFRGSGLENGYAVLRRKQSDSVKALGEEILVAIESAETAEIPSQECAVYLPAERLGLEADECSEEIQSEISQYLLSHSLVANPGREAGGIAVISRDLTIQATGLYSLLRRSGQLEKDRDHVARVGLAVTIGGVCTKMHVDQVFARTLCTYLGMGTEYLEPEKEPPPPRNRASPGELWKWLPGLGGRDHSNTPGRRLGKCNEADILLVKGDKWIGGEPSVHRSPTSYSVRMIARVDIHTAEFSDRLKRSEQANRV